MAYRITPAHDPVVQIEFELPIKGRKPLKFTLPKIHYLTGDVFDQHDKWTDSEDAQKLLPGSVGREAEGTRALLKIVAPEHAAVWDGLTNGELMEISTHWNRESRLTFPESEASAES